MMGAPQIIYVVLMALAGATILERDGKPRTGNYDFGTWFVAKGLLMALLWWGGFFG